MKINSNHRLLSNALSGLKLFLFATCLVTVAQGAVESSEARSSTIRFESRPWAEAVYNSASADDSITIEGGRLQESTTWAPPNTHLVFNSVYVPQNITLTIVTNSVVKFCEGTFIKVEDGGKLNIVGSEEENVVLTAANDNTIGTTVPGIDPSDTLEFKGIVLSSSSANFTDNGWIETRGFNFSSYPNITIRDTIAFRSSGSVIIPISVSGTRDQSFMIDWEAIDGTATYGADYTLAFGSITWTSTSDGTKNIEVPLVVYHIVGTNTTFTVRIKAARGANIQRGTSVVTIKELTALNIESASEESEAIRFESRDWAEAVFNAASTNEMIIIEGGRLTASTTWNPPETHLVFNTVYVPNGITLTINANTIVKFCEGTCIKVEDGGKLNIVGAEGQDVIFTSANDNTVGTTIPGLDPDQTIEFKGIVLSSSNATFTDNGFVQTRGFQFSSFPSLSVRDIEVFRTQGTASILVSVTGTRNQSFSVEWKTEDGTATLSNDFTVGEGTITWANTSAGNKNIEIPLVVDRNAGTNTNFKVKLTIARGANIAKGECTVTIKELDTLNIDSAFEESESIRFESRDWAEAVYNAASTNEMIIIEGGRLKANTTWNPPETHLVFNTVYVPNGITLTINAGTIVKFCEGTCIKVEDGGKLNVVGAEDADVVFTAANDTTVGENISGLDPETTFTYGGIVLSSSNATFTDNGWLETRNFSVSTYPTLTLNSAIANRNSGKIYLPVTLSGSTRDQSFSVDWEAIDGTAKLSDDYTVSNGRITWANSNAGTKNIEIPLVTDHIVGSNVTFTVHFKALRGANANNKEIIATIAEFKTGNLKPDTFVGMADSEPSPNTDINEGILLQQLFLNETEHIQYSGKWQTYNKDEAAALRVTVESDNGLTVLKECSPTETGSFDLKPADYAVGFYTLKHEIVNSQGNVLATMKKTFSITDPEKVELHGGTLTQNETWTPDKIHVVYATVYVPTTYTLFIEPGTIVKFMAGTGIELLGGGAFFANAIIFTNIEDDTVGGDTMSDGYTGKPNVDTYFLKGNFHFSGDTELRNITQLEPLTGTISGDKMLARGSIYRVSGNLTIPSGSTLTILPGTIIKMESGARITVNDGGVLNANGTHASPIIITSIKDDSIGGDTNKDGNRTYPQPGDWRQICVNGGTLNASYVSLLYLSNDNNQGGVYVNNGEAIMDGCTIAHCNYDCMRVTGGKAVARNSVFTDSSMGIAPAGGETECINCVFSELTTGVRWPSGVFKNCVFSQIYEDIIDTSFGDGCVFSNCVFYNPEGRNHAESQVGRNNNIYADPLFVDPANGDFRIVEGSPCVDAADTEVAPETDYFGQPRITITDQGTNTVGQLADIGICEVMPRNIASDIDLIPQTITSVTNAVPGQQIFIKWEIANVGGRDITGSWRDTISLVSENGFEIELGEKVTTSTIGAGGSVFCSGYFVIPAINEGNYFPKVNVNSYHDIFEGNLTANNALVGDKVINVVLESTDPSVVQSDIIYAGAQKVLKLSFREGDENRMVTFNVPKGVRITWGFSTMPTSGMSLPGVSGSSNSSGNVPVQFRVPEDATDVYVILESDETATYELSTDTTKLSLISVYPSTLPSSGTTTISATCTGYGATNVLVLVSGNNRIELPIESIDINGNLVATIDCSKLSAGKTYDAILQSDDEEALLDQCISVEQVEGKGILEYESELPTSARPGRIFTFIVRYRNVGNQDLCCPIVTIQDTGDDEENPMQFSLDGTTFIPGELKFVGLDANGYLDAIHPGDEVTLHIMARIPPANNGSASISVRVNSETDIMAQYTNEIDKYITPKIKMEYENSTNVEFRAYYENLEKVFGSTNGDMIGNFATFAKMFFDSNRILLQQIDDLIPFGINIIKENVVSNENPTFITSQKLQPENNQIKGLFFNDPTGAYLYPNNEYITDNSDDLSGCNVVVIAHGLNDAKVSDDLWMNKMASKLVFEGYRVILVNWSKEASSWRNGISFRGLAASPAYDLVLSHLNSVSANIPDIAQIVYKQLQYCKIDPSKTIFIGHSFGSHLLGYLARTYYGGRIERHIGLDTAAHLATPSYCRAWSGDAKITEYYRSSSGSGCAEPYAKFNYIVAKNGNFEAYHANADKIIDNFTADHSYAIEWLTKSIDNKPKGIGFWSINGKPKDLQNLDNSGYAAVIDENLNTECTYKFGVPEFSYPGNQPNWISTYLKWIRIHDLDITKGNIHLPDNARLKACQEVRIPIDVYDNSDIKTASRAFGGDRIKVTFIEKLDSNSEYEYPELFNDDFDIKVGIHNATHRYIDLKMPYIPFRNNQESVSGRLRFVVTPSLDNNNNKRWDEIYNVDNIKEIPVTIIRSNGPCAAINGRSYNDFEIEYKIPFSSQENYNDAYEKGEKTRFRFNSQGSKGGDYSIETYEWCNGVTVIGDKSDCAVQVNACSDSRYPISLTISTEAGSDTVSGYLHVIPIIKDDPKPIEQPHSCDPNEMNGPLGVGDPETERFIKPGEWLTYTVYFENTSNATAAAQEVYVTNEMDKWLDWSTFEMGEIVYNNKVDLSLAGVHAGTCETAVEGTNYNVKTSLEFDDKKGVAKWYMRIVDPATETGWPEDILIGFLPPNDETYRGEGHLTYRIRLREDAPAGTRINNSATIVFDYNEPIETDPAWWNTVAKMHQVEFDGGVTNLNLVVGAEYGELPAPSEREGRTFIGWFTEPGGAGREITRETIVSEDDGPLYAYWSANAYTVNYLPNGGEGEVESQSVTYESEFSLRANSFTYKSHKFVGWGTSEGGEAVYSAGQTVSNLTAVANGVVDMYAVWEEWTTEVKFVSLGAETNLTFVVEQPYGTLPEVDEKLGWTFGGWFTGEDGSGDSVSSDTIVAEGDGPIYAYWTPNEYMVNYLPNGGEGAMESLNAVYEESFALPSNEFTRTSYQFVGWGTNDSDVAYSEGQVVSNLTAEANGTVNLFAVWELWTTEVRFVSLGTETNLTFVVEQPYGQLPSFEASEGWTFLGWFTEPNGEGQEVTEETLVDANVETLYAHWHHDVVVLSVNCLQAWPLDRRVIINYTLAGRTNETLSVYSVKFYGTVDGGESFFELSERGEISRDGVTGIVLGEGEHKTLWMPDETLYDVRIEDMQIKVVAEDVTEAATYLILDLESNRMRIDVEGPVLTNDACRTSELWLRRIEPGSFMMGSPSDELGRNDNEVLHEVKLTGAYYIGVFETTQKQYETIMGSNPSVRSGLALPVENVSYEALRGSVFGAKWPLNGKVDRSSFFFTLREKTGDSLWFDLPTEAQWEYACRAGYASAFGDGCNITNSYVDGSLDKLGWYANNSYNEELGTNSSQRVGTRAPNDWGLYDMHGNVFEWCLDWFGNYNTNAVTEPRGADGGFYRVLKGGSWQYYAYYCRSGYHRNESPNKSDSNSGFRIILLKP